MMRDFRYALRGLRKSPGFASATVLTLALGIGANSAIFSVVNAILLKPLPYKDPQQLVIVYSTAPGDPRDFVSQPDLDDWRASAQSFSGFASFVPQSVNLTGTETPDRVIGSFVSSNYFDLLGVKTARGRSFLAGEDKQGAGGTAVITDGLWHRRFGADANVIGRKLIFNGEPYTVIGVLGPNFVDQPWNAEVYLPAFEYPNYSPDRATANAAIIGRMRPGVPIAKAQAEMNTIAASLSATYPKSNRNRGALVVPMKEIVVEDLRPSILALAGAVGFVLLIACANVAGLFAARMLSREQERAVRLALGATKLQLASHVLAEAVVLAIAGGLAGLLLAAWSIEGLEKAIADQLPAGVHLALDSTVLLFTVGIALISALLIAAIPAFPSSARAAVPDGRSAGSGAMRNRVRSILAAAEIAMAMILLAGAGLTIKSLLELGKARTGFDPSNLVTFEYRVPRAKYPSGAAQTEFHRRVVEQIRSIPGVAAASSVRAVPLGGNGETDDFFIADRPEPAASERPRTLFNAADPDFFNTMRIPVLRGRVFNEHDSAGSPQVAVINQTLWTRYYGDRDPVGKHIRIPEQHLNAEIIGVVGDVKQFSPEDKATPQVYGALSQNAFLFTSVAVRTAGDPAILMNQIRQAVWQVDKDQPMWKMRTVDARLGTLAQPRRLFTTLLGGYAGLALLLASIGIFSVISYSARQRAGEIGIRMALGAQPRDVARLIFREGAMVTLIGLAVGIGGAAWIARLLRAQLFMVSPLDPGVYAAVAILLAAVSFAACLIPMRRAMRVDPIEVLRHN